MFVTIHGPNLSAAAQRKGDLHVHAADCADNAHYGPGRRYGGEDNGWNVNVGSQLDATVAVYPSEDFGWSPSDPDDRAVYLQSLYFAPCTRELPEVAPGTYGTPS